MKRLALVVVLAAAVPAAGHASGPAATKPAAAAKAAAPAAAKGAPKKAAAAPTAGAKPPDGWKEVVAKDAGFTAWFPGEPQHQLENRAGALLGGYMLDRDGDLASVAVFMVSAGEEGQELADGIFGLVTQEEGSKVTREYQATLDGKPARGFDVETPDSAITARRAVVFGRHYLLLLRVPRGAAIPEADARAFFGSFHAVAELDAPPAAAEPAAPARPLPPATPATGFKEFVAKDAGFAIAFPGEPERETNEDGTFTGYRLKGAKGGCSFIAITVTAKGEDVKAVLDEQVTRLVDAFGPSIQRDEPATIGGLPGRALTSAQGDSRIEIRFVVAKNRLHGLMVAADGAAPSEADQKAFFGSFRSLP
ncbi:DcrB/PsbP domain-containing protein [Anaeromyxobacter oryzae]|uniref:Lipoprotein n=1 Tax=Anaeromyxobacter oryzae TaxID=2918170 RepID=A0ABM7X232_9BACT|nr:hypothetical protein [Anaeromyxobacter oryzae]BDG05840.1 hypothetical protein AMOR_48360 [Anaeromyxobacter oryzae]